MDETVNALLTTLLLAGCAGLAHAQELRDPTRPPATLMRAADGAADAVAAGPQLQSILIARQAGGRHVVVIDGQTLRLGDRHNGARLARITPTQVVLEHGGKRQVLQLASAAAAAPAAASTSSAAPTTR